MTVIHNIIETHDHFLYYNHDVSIQQSFETSIDYNGVEDLRGYGNERNAFISINIMLDEKKR
jgi:hypothetical protein